MIVYNTRNWIESFKLIKFAYKKGENYKQMLLWSVIVAIYSAIITFLDLHVLEANFRIDPMYFSLIGFIISLLLVFRLNTAYEKWWEGRKQWGALVNECRILSSLFHALLAKEDISNRKFMAAQISNFAFSLKEHLQDDYLFNEIEDVEKGYFDDLKNSSNIPHKIATQILVKVEELIQSYHISEFDKLNIKEQVQQLLHILGACERIKNTPIPFSHSSFIKTLIALYILALPFGLINFFLYLTIPTCTIISYALIGLEVISDEIEQPFGKELNDLPLNHLSSLIKYNVYDILNVDPQIEPIPQKINLGLQT
ncbi:MAG: hypothetical protein KTR26_20495 [Flammeovirgaceae bacterium]|nr:hypothetical protein [Flammeovirgaceae bacterium]